jgi:hypothetical protein
MYLLLSSAWLSFLSALAEVLLASSGQAAEDRARRGGEVIQSRPLCKAKRGFAYEKSLLESVLRMNLPHLAADGVEHDHVTAAIII